MQKRSYEDILQLQHPTSKRHPRMPLYNRAAQFAPFAALNGYEDAIREAIRRTEEEAQGMDFLIFHKDFTVR